MGTGRTDEFRKDAVRIALTSGLTRRQDADEVVNDIGMAGRGFRAVRRLLRQGELELANMERITTQAIVRRSAA